ncbi:Fimbria A protein precursor [Providencia rustigianii]|uniref:Fimbria A protein n=5 Tax=Providencia rustigianii TaxID=158850 RepID=D1P169_9GAMM|nr:MULTISPECIES: fimbrial protein [Providencia]EFB73088.1 fimbria A protein [Providencia rustigianii DSM 4541]MTC56825.1 fimbrial protein [Providencia rustigianii]SPY76036.1 Fimbria A protein precursor [Providencia rustigianii]SUC25175.1 Fimbria A protein precursor [Providencia rustigianii]SUC34006.1 Fimbria A protein precursor [Providencia rustigianii]
MKKIILATLISGVMSSSALAVDAGSGTVTFSGSIIEAPCSIAPGEENQEVALGQVSNVTLDNGSESSAQPFQIKLEGCNLKGDNQVAVTFKGTEAGTNTGYLQITGDATGAAVKIMNGSGAQIKVNSSAKQNYVEGNNTLKFQASLIGLQLVDKDSKPLPVTPGQFQAVTNFTLAYN